MLFFIGAILSCTQPQMISVADPVSHQIWSELLGEYVSKERSGDRLPQKSVRRERKKNLRTEGKREAGMLEQRNLSRHRGPTPPTKVCKVCPTAGGSKSLEKNGNFVSLGA